MIAYYAYRLAGMVVPLIPRRVGMLLMAAAASLAYRFSAGNRAMIQANLRHVLGDSDARSRERAARGVFCNLFKNYFDLFWLPKQPRQKLAHLVRVHGLDRVLPALAQGKGAIAVAGHLGNVELMSQVRVIGDFKVTAVAEHVRPERLYRYLLSLRQTSGIRLIAQDGALRELFRALQRGEVVALAFDRDVTDSGRVIPLFGSPAKLPDGYAILSLKYGVPLVPVFIMRGADDTFDVFLEQPLTFHGRPDSDEDVRRVMTSVAAVFERYIARYPDQWVYFHYVWEDDKQHKRET